MWARLGRLAYGADYNPEQWDEETWSEDVKLMADAGVNLVSLAIFGWASLQPAPDRFDWSWLDRVMDLLGDAGISVCLATATASPPPWLVAAHPEILPVDVAGNRLWHGSRQHFCPSSPAYREAAGTLAGAMAERFGGHPALASWHIGNEYGCHVSRCYCDSSAEDFRAWLRDRYGDLGALNEAWSTAFWSQRYGAWDEIIPPRQAPTFPNPAQELDFSRFSSDALLACFDNEKAVLRRITPEVAVTTNFLGIWNPVDSFAWAGAEDFVSHDSYPDPADPDAAASAAIAFDLMRGAKGGAPWLLLEQAPSAVNWRERNQPKTAAQYRLWSWQAIAHGSNGCLSFQWRASRGGAEKFHSAMVPHAGAGHPVHRYVADLGRELASLPELAATVPGRAEVAILFDWSSWWALELPSRPSSHLRLMELVAAYYRPLFDASIPVDLLPPDADLTGYRLAVVPNLYLLDQAVGERIARWVEGGGHLAVGFFSGIADGNDRIHPGAYPGALRGVLGVTVDQFWPLGPGEVTGLRLGSGEAAQARVWTEEIVVDDAEVAASFEGGPLDGRPAMTVATRGRGRARYAGTLPDAGTLRAWVHQAAAEAGAESLLARTAPGIEAQRRTGDGFEVLFVLNHDTSEQTAGLHPGWVSLLGPEPDGGELRLAAQQVAVLRRDAGSNPTRSES